MDHMGGVGGYVGGHVAVLCFVDCSIFCAGKLEADCILIDPI